MIPPRVCMTDPERDIYHSIGAIRDNGQKMIFDWDWTTGCGKVIHRVWGIKSMPTKKAALIARPCSICFGKPDAP